MSTEPSTEPLTSEAAGSSEAAARCSSCGSAIAHDQRYCLECGERLAPVSGFLLGRSPGRRLRRAPRPLPRTRPRRLGRRPPRSNVLGVLGGVGLLLLAMGVGVLIGRAGNSKPAPAKEQVITEQAPAASTGGRGHRSELHQRLAHVAQRLHGAAEHAVPSSSTVAAVSAAKTAATAKGAPAVGALASSEFSSLPSGSYVIYSGDYASAAQAKKALAGLHDKFPGAKVIHVTGGGSGSGAGKGGSTTNGGSLGRKLPTGALEPQPPRPLHRAEKPQQPRQELRGSIQKPARRGRNGMSRAAIRGS